MTDDLASRVEVHPGNSTLEPVATSQPVDKGRASQLPALMGLRGVAALTVVISHVLNTDPGLVHPHMLSIAWWFSYTPVNVLWDGDEAVLMFYVLSGFVLARPLTKGRQSESYLAYYPRRLLRLYPPLWGALVFTFLLTLVESRHNIPGATQWTNSQSNFHTSTLQDAVLPRVGTTFDGPLWSLRWELLFSLTLPLYVFLGKAFKRYEAVKVLAMLAILLLGVADLKVNDQQISDAILYMPMFGVGVIMAFYERELVGWFSAFMRRSIWNRVGLIVFVIVTGDFTSEISPIKGIVPGVVVTFAHGLGILGAAVAILAVLSWQPFAGALQARPIAWVGRRSYSLYLIHDAILMTIILWLGGHPNPVVALALVLPACLIGLALFYRFVERPTHKLSSNAGRAVQRWVDRRRTGGVQPAAG
jgi:peptidoglycan/LPS O-acetylase OafA/YrhL